MVVMVLTADCISNIGSQIPIVFTEEKSAPPEGCQRATPLPAKSSATNSAINASRIVNLLRLLRVREN
jgi:hypothetical protein